MGKDDLKLSKKCFVKCGKGHRAFKVPGEKDTFYCSECELKITSEDTPKYVSQQSPEKKKGPKKTPGPKKKTPMPAGEIAEVVSMVGKIKLVCVDSCNNCLHKEMCWVVKSNPKANLNGVRCPKHFKIVS